MPRAVSVPRGTRISKAMGGMTGTFKPISGGKLNAEAKRKDGTAIEVESSPIAPGTYCLVWKTQTGVYRANTIGYITP